MATWDDQLVLSAQTSYSSGVALNVQVRGGDCYLLPEDFVHEGQSAGSTPFFKCVELEGLEHAGDTGGALVVALDPTSCFALHTFELGFVLCEVGVPNCRSVFDA